MTTKTLGNTKYVDFKGRSSIPNGNTELKAWGYYDYKGSIELRYVVYDDARQNIETGMVVFDFDESYVDGGAVIPTRTIYSTVGTVNVAFSVVFDSGRNEAYVSINNSDASTYSIEYEMREVLVLAPPKIQMTISGLSPGQKFRGLYNGTHILTPETYTRVTRNSDGVLNQERWGFDLRPNFPYSSTSPSGEFDARVDFRAVCQSPYAGHYSTYIAFYVYQSRYNYPYGLSTVMIGALNSWYGSPIFSQSNGDVFGRSGLLQDRTLSNSGTISGITFSWQRLPNQPKGAWALY